MTSLRSRAVGGLKWTTIAAIVCSVLQIAKMAVLARLIAREDFGVFATISVVLGFAEYFVEAGLGSAVIHRQSASKEELGTAYTINIILGWFVFIVLFFASSPIAKFYNDFRLIIFLKLATLTFLFQPLGRQYDALLRRDLQFDTLAKFDICSAFISLSISVILAYQQYGVLALIFSQLFIALLRTVYLLWIGCKKYGFNIGFSSKSAYFFCRFAIFQICENTVNYFNGQLDVILIGKLLGQDALGVFYMAKQLALRPTQIINPIINKISLPIFAKVQNDSLRLKRGYLQIVHTLAIIYFPLFILISGFSEEIVRIFLGDNWGIAGNLLRILSYYSMIRALNNPIGSLLIAMGRVDIGFYWNFCMLFYSPTIMVFSSQWGPIGMAWGLFCAALGSSIPFWYFLVRKLCGASFVEYYKEIFLTALIAISCLIWGFMSTSLLIKFVLFFFGILVYLFVHRKVLYDLRLI